jgi:signal peptidase I
MPSDIARRLRRLRWRASLRAGRLVRRLMPRGGRPGWWRFGRWPVWLKVCVKTLAVSLAAFLFVARPVRLLVVTGASMRPAMSPGDVAVVVRRMPVAPGDIACFADGSGLVCHRLVRQAFSGWETKGDANATPDSRPVSPERVSGKVVFTIPAARARDVAAALVMGYHRLQAKAWP